MYKRTLSTPNNYSFFLFGARGTGKTTLLETIFNPEEAVWFDLLNPDLEEKYQLRPESFQAEIDALIDQKNIQWIIIDEIQKVPSLLNLVQKNMRTKRFHFVLTGSSARKLKRGAANLLAGRAAERRLFPLTSFELNQDFSLERVLQFGTLPETMGRDDTGIKDYLRSYANTYLKEEILEEQLIRKVNPFRAFLQIAAVSSGKILNYSSIARDVGSDSVTVKKYFEILEDTYLGFRLLPYHRSVRKRQISHPKFYLFDLGVTRALNKTLDVPLIESTSEYGQAFEQFVVLEIYRQINYLKPDWTMSYLTTKDNVEVDLIIERPGMKTCLIEIKSSRTVREDHCVHLKNFLGDFPDDEFMILSRDLRPKKFHNRILSFSWQEGIRQLLGPSL